MLSLPLSVTFFFNRLLLSLNPAAPCMYILRLRLGWQLRAVCLFVCGEEAQQETCFLVLGRRCSGRPAATSPVCVLSEDQLVYHNDGEERHE